MEKDNCNDRDGNSHFGEYGFWDGYNGSTGNCRCGLNSRAGACKDVDGCMEEAHKKCVEQQYNIISFNINNMVAGERQRAKESIDDKKIADARRAKDKEEAEKTKLRSEAKAEGKIICFGCGEKIDPKESKEVKQGIIECPKCGKKINGQTGDLILGEEVKETKKEESKKEEPKKEEAETEEKKEEPKKEEVKPVEPEAKKEETKVEEKKDETKKL